MDKYRKLYNDNFLGTTDVSILKFYYASFKIQQAKGKITDVKQFLDDCVKISYDTSFLLKVLGVLPFVNIWLGTGKEQKRIADLIVSKRTDVERLFLQYDISDNEIAHILYGSAHSVETKPTLTTAEQIELAKEYILKCYSIKGKKQLGDRIFGYLIASEIIPAYTPESRLESWRNLMGETLAPSDTKLHATPSLNRSSVDSKNLRKHLDSIRELFYEIGMPKVVEIIQRDLNNL